MKRSVAWIAVALLLALSPAAARAQGQPCAYQGSQYSDGSLSCQHGVQQQCLGGNWVDQGQTCTGDSGGAAGQMGMDSGAEEPAGTDAFMPGDSQGAPPMPDDMP